MPHITPCQQGNCIYGNKTCHTLHHVNKGTVSMETRHATHYTMSTRELCIYGNKTCHTLHHVNKGTVSMETRHATHYTMSTRELYLWKQDMPHITPCQQGNCIYGNKTCHTLHHVNKGTVSMVTRHATHYTMSTRELYLWKQDMPHITPCQQGNCIYGNKTCHTLHHVNKGTVSMETRHATHYTMSTRELYLWKQDMPHITPCQQGNHGNNITPCQQGNCIYGNKTCHTLHHVNKGTVSVVTRCEIQ